MSRRRVARALLALLVSAPALSCGGASQPALRPQADRTIIAEAPARVIAPAQVPELPPEEPEPPPVDGAHQAHTDLSLSDQALASRYPLYGVAFQALSQVFEKPDVNSFVIGLMRRGTTLRASEPIKTAMKGHGCDGTWHELWTRGYICRGLGFQLGRSPQTFTPAPVPAALYDALPYPYAKNTAKVALQYFRVPSESEQKESEASFAAMQALLEAEAEKAAKLPPKPAPPPAPEEDEQAAADPGQGMPLPPLVRMAMAPGFYVSVDGKEQAGEREFARTVRGAYVETKTLADVTLPQAAGGPIASNERLPLGIVYREGAKVSERDPVSGQMVATGALPRFTRVALHSGTPVDTVGSLLTRSGQLVQGSKLRRVEKVVRPALVPKNARLIHVRLAEQTLVAYEGERPVYATLVSSGKEGFETPAGLFRIHAKHVSTTMDGLAGEEDEYSIEDVPWTMYFQGSYALHAAFWHDRFGNTRSHGCVNLSPIDARWLFEWATPTLPSGFHAAMSTRDNPGTYVLVE
jgi:hypothetical protein